MARKKFISLRVSFFFVFIVKLLAKQPSEMGAFRFMCGTKKELGRLYENRFTMTKREKVAAVLQKFGFKLSSDEPVKLAAVDTADGKKIYTDAEKFAKGVSCFEDEAGTKPCADGDYKLASGETLTVAGGKVSDIKEEEKKMTEEETLEAVNALATKLDETTTEKEKVEAELTTVKEKLSAVEKKNLDLIAENRVLASRLVPDPTKIHLSKPVKPSEKEWEKMSHPERIAFTLSQSN